MTVANTNDRDTFTGDGSQTVFPFSFRCTDDTHVTVFINDDPVLTGFKVKRNLNGVGGTITFNVAPANGAEGDIVRVSDLLQNDSLQANESLNTKTLENMIDKLTIIAQQFNRDFAGVVRLAASIDPETVNTLLPSYIPGYLIGWDIDSQALRTVSPIQAFSDLVPDTDVQGDVFGPAGSTAERLAVFANSSGKLLKDGPLPGTEGNVVTSEGGAWVSKPLPAAPPTEAFVMPSGSIMFFAHASHVPAGWEVMAGQTVTINGGSFVTPDTRGKYLMCASQDDTGSGGYTGAGVVAGATAGAKQHNHVQSGTFITTASNPGSNAASQIGSGAVFNYKSNATLNHQHNVTISGTTGQMAEANRPIQIALLAAIKVDEE